MKREYVKFAPAQVGWRHGGRVWHLTTSDGRGLTCGKPLIESRVKAVAVRDQFPDPPCGVCKKLAKTE